LPPGAELAEAYNRVVGVADEVIGSPRSVDASTHDDGTLDVEVWHSYSVDSDVRGKHREVLRYHSERGWKVAVLFRHYDDDEKTCLKYEERVAPDVLLESGRRIRDRGDC